MGIAVPSEPSAAQEQLLARLSEEKTIDALNRLLDRLDVIAFTADALSGFLSRADVVAEYLASRREVAALTAEDSGSAYLVRNRDARAEAIRLAGQPTRAQ